MALRVYIFLRPDSAFLVAITRGGDDGKECGEGWLGEKGWGAGFGMGAAMHFGLDDIVEAIK
ncbi:MAG TPA: hypothetical protein VGO47_11450 [Chlamydiales bacterium]|nr:hypothetical protein [Chlamydiales bacterium]